MGRDQSISAAILQHQKECLSGIQEMIGNIWKKIGKISDHQDRLTNDDDTGKVDVLWKAHEKKQNIDEERRKYWTRWIVATLTAFFLGNLGVLVWFLGKIQAVIQALRH